MESAEGDCIIPADSLVTTNICGKANPEKSKSENVNISNSKDTEPLNSEKKEKGGETADKNVNSNIISNEAVDIELKEGSNPLNSDKKEEDVENIVSEENNQSDSTLSLCYKINTELQECADITKTNSIQNNNVEDCEVNNEKISIKETIPSNELKSNKSPEDCKFNADASSTSVESGNEIGNVDNCKDKALNISDVISNHTTIKVDTKVEEDNDIQDAEISFTGLKVDGEANLSHDEESTLIVTIDDYEAPLYNKDCKNDELVENTFENLHLDSTESVENKKNSNTVLDEKQNSNEDIHEIKCSSEPNELKSEILDENNKVTSTEINSNGIEIAGSTKALSDNVVLENQPIEHVKDEMLLANDDKVECINTVQEKEDVKTFKKSSSLEDDKSSLHDSFKNNEKTSIISEQVKYNDTNISKDQLGEFIFNKNEDDSPMKTETEITNDEDIEKMSVGSKSADTSDAESNISMEDAFKSVLEKNEEVMKTNDEDIEKMSVGSNSADKCDAESNISVEDAIKSVLKKNEEAMKTLLSVPSNLSDVNMNESEERKNSVKETEIISLVDDEDDKYSNCKKKPAAAINCINPNCMSGEDLDKPAMFVLSYFGLKRGKNQKVCAECFDLAVEHQEKLVAMLKEGESLIEAEFPDHKDVILLDSDEESFSEDESYLSDDTMDVLRNNLDDVFNDALVRYNIDHQIRESCDYLNNKIDNLEEVKEHLNKSYNEVQKKLDKYRKQIYEKFINEIQEKEELQLSDCEFPPMPILMSQHQLNMYNRDVQNRFRKRQLENETSANNSSTSSPMRTIATKRVSQNTIYQSDSLNQDIIALDSELRMDPPPNLPPPGTLDRRKLKVGDTVYCMKVSYFSIWVHARVIEVIPRNTTENDPSTETYRVRLESAKKNAVRTVTGKYLAYPEPPKVQPPVGTRVIAIFKEEDESVDSKENYYVGVIAEPPKAINRYRYLVFFDDGYTQYCPHNNILVVCSSNKNVWEDIHPEPREFICNYLKQYPERPMVKLSRGQVVKVEWNGRWWIVRVLEVDASLVKVHFDADKRTEWIYRGSSRLGPMYQELAAAKERQSGSLLRSRGFGNAGYKKSDMPYVEYTRGDNDEKSDEEEKEDKTQTVPTRSVARKSTSKKPAELVISNPEYSKPLVPHIPVGNVTQRTLKEEDIIKPLRFRPHQCNKACVAWTGYTPDAAKRHDPLMRPLYYGFERLLVGFRGKTVVMYRAPCGRTIRTQQEMLCYLQGTKSSLTIDLFDFDFWVNPLNQFKESRTFCRIEDLSYGKENVPISCVNELDHCMPQYVQYMTARQPAKDVPLNLDSDYLVGCDCQDDCEDRENCSCWQLTMQGKAYVPDGDLDPLFGYQYRRLPERLATGIYECNSRCKCSATCQNRVAQQPLSFRLQLFKTPKKGWGIRCLHDIPRGSFICIYVGFLLTDQEANEGGKTYGDEYLAELDYIESVENLKEGYETEVIDFSENEESGEEGIGDGEMDIECEEEGGSADSDQGSSNFRSQHREDIRLRLRRRLPGEREKDNNKKSKPDDDAISISDEENEPVRKPQTFNAHITKSEDHEFKYPSVRDLYGPSESVYIMDAKTHGNIGRYLNHSCSPNVFVQNVFVDTHDLRFPWVAFFANQYISAGTELTWDYNYDVGSVPGKVMLCYCNSLNCRGRLL